MAAVLQPLYDELEANYTIEVWSGFCSKYLYVPFVSSAVYLILIQVGKKFMQDRDAFKLRGVLTVWNATLATFSILGTTVMAPPLIKKLTEKDWIYQSVCFSSISTSPWLGLWATLFVLSKLVEYGDTFFVILRKTPLNFLHWYHHITVLWYSWYGLATHNEAGHWFCTMNYFVHSIMYTYYTVKSSGVRVSSSIAQLITILQLSQFFVGIAVILAASWFYWNDYKCGIVGRHLVTGFIMYGSYMILFVNFFYHRYIKKTHLTIEHKKEQ